MIAGFISHCWPVLRVNYTPWKWFSCSHVRVNLMHFSRPLRLYRRQINYFSRICVKVDLKFTKIMSLAIRDWFLVSETFEKFPRHTGCSFVFSKGSSKLRDCSQRKKRPWKEVTFFGIQYCLTLRFCGSNGQLFLFIVCCLLRFEE